MNCVPIGETTKFLGIVCQTNIANKNLPGGGHDDEDKDTVELSRGTPLKKFTSPPEPAVDYELPSKSWQDTATSNFAAVNNPYGSQLYRSGGNYNPYSESKLRTRPEEQWFKPHPSADQLSPSRLYFVLIIFLYSMFY